MDYYFFRIDCAVELSFNVILDCRYEIEDVLEKLGYFWTDNGEFFLFEAVVRSIAKKHGCSVSDCKKIAG